MVAFDKIKVSDLIAEFLEEKEIKVVFGIIGSANAYIFDSINERGYTRIVNVHHEQAAVMAMGAYYRTSRKLSASLVTAGPGAANAITGIISCWADSIPGLIISGQEATQHIKHHKKLRMIGTQGFDIADMVKNVTKYSKDVREPEDIQDELEKAYDTGLEGRFGPTLLSIPFDVQSQKVVKREWNIQLQKLYDIPQNDIDYIIECLKSSKRPVILGGHGIRLSGSQNSFLQLINKTKIPTLLTWAGIDILETDNEHFYGRAGVYGQRCANFVIQNSDVLLVLGSRLALPQVGYDITAFAPEAKIIVVDIDETEIKKYENRCDKLIVADCSVAINKLLSSLGNDFYYKSEWANQCSKWREKYPWIMNEHKDDGYINSYKFIDRLSDCMKDDQIIVTDMGTGLLSGHQGIKLKSNQTMFTSTGLGEMGYGLPAAIGAAFAGRGREVLCLNCDGGMMMNLQELQTIIQYDLPVKIIIFNNDGYLMIKHTQKMLFKGKLVSSNKKSGITLPDYAKVAHAFGFESYRINSWDQYDKTIKRFLNSKKQAICEVFMGPEQDFIPKVKGVVRKDQTIMPAPLEEMSPLLPLEVIKEEMIIDINEKSLQMKRK